MVDHRDAIDDHEALYDREIVPLIDRIYRLCKGAGIPFVVMFEYAPSRFVTSGIVPEGASELIHRLADAVAPDPAIDRILQESDGPVRPSRDAEATDAPP